MLFLPQNSGRASGCVKGVVLVTLGPHEWTISEAFSHRLLAQCRCGTQTRGSMDLFAAAGVAGCHSNGSGWSGCILYESRAAGGSSGSVHYSCGEGFLGDFDFIRVGATIFDSTLD